MMTDKEAKCDTAIVEYAKYFLEARNKFRAHL